MLNPRQAGDVDYACNAAGVRRWVRELEWTGGDGFRNATEQPWFLDGAKQPAGVVRRVSLSSRAASDKPPLTISMRRLAGPAAKVFSRTRPSTTPATSSRPVRTARFVGERETLFADALASRCSLHSETSRGVTHD